MLYLLKHNGMQNNINAFVQYNIHISNQKLINVIVNMDITGMKKKVNVTLTKKKQTMVIIENIIYQNTKWLI